MHLKPTMPMSINATVALGCACWFSQSASAACPATYPSARVNAYS
jgi:hypothetical protein